MPAAVSNTSPLLYLHRIGALEGLPMLFDQVWIPGAVVRELEQGRLKGYDVPDPDQYVWLHEAEPLAMPSEWLALDLGPGELAAMALALEHPDRVVLLDDALAQRIAQAAGLEVWGTLKVVLETKARGLTDQVGPVVDRLEDAGLWVSDEIRHRILVLAGEA